MRFDDSPWVRDATIALIGSVEWPTQNPLYWSELDVDLSVRSIRVPQPFSLISRTGGDQVSGVRSRTDDARSSFA